MSRFQFVADNSATFEVKRLCELVEIERSSYYAWLKVMALGESPQGRSSNFPTLGGCHCSGRRVPVAA